MAKRHLWLLLLLAAPGCWWHVEDYCSGCAIVQYARPAVPAPPAGTRTEVVLVHGAFGFGDEWTPVVDALRQSPGISFLAWSWPGPFRQVGRSALGLREELQALLDGLPPEVSELLVLAHSAGGLVTNYAARHLKVPAGRKVTVALLDPALSPALVSATPGEPDPYPPLPPGVSMTVYPAKDPPPPPPPGKPAQKTEAPSGVHATDLPVEYVGAVGHNPMVAKVALPLIAARRR